jgi:hypothetical protein
MQLSTMTRELLRRLPQNNPLEAIEVQEAGGILEILVRKHVCK